jgi:hypothetical protein
MTAPRDTLSLKLAAARKRHADALKRVAAEEAAIEELLAKRRAQFTRELRRNAHRPVRLGRVEREIEALLREEVSL